MIDEKISGFSALCEKSLNAKTFVNVVFSSPKSGDVLKIKGCRTTVSGKDSLRLEYSMTEGRVRQENILTDVAGAKIGELCGGFSRCDLNDNGGNASLLTSKKGKITLITHGKIGTGEINEPQSADKKKQYILSGGEKFLFCLGISDKNGRVHDKKQAKFRQINRFLEYVRDMLKFLPKEKTLQIADLCCGKSYLSFAVYHYLVNVLNTDVRMDCVDLKESVIAYCAEIAEQCGFSNMRFFAGDISKYKPDGPLHMVISLHACDTATDIVLDRAAALGAEVILSTPCCHRELSRKIDCESLRFLCGDSVLKSKFCDAATDALRLLRLKACGYTADATEFTDPEDTPKNVLLRAHLDKGFKYGLQEKYKKEYCEAYYFLCGKKAPDLPCPENYG